MEQRFSPLESMEVNQKEFWKNRKVFLTGHTGFKGSWLALWLSDLGAEVSGYALNPSTRPNLYKLCRLEELVDSTIADIRDAATLKRVLSARRPEIIFHLAAQPLVRESYRVPVETYETNVMGTANLLEAVRSCRSVKAVLNITSDKCYENPDHSHGKSFKETDPLGGYDPYSSSKACAEIVTAAYRRSFLAEKGVAVATARAGNVIGGGDWAEDRLIPDFVRAITQGKKIFIRNPGAVRPWQHVLEPLNGYILLAQKLHEKGNRYAEAWNFGPEKSDCRDVEWLVKKLCAAWGAGAGYRIDKRRQPHEACFLRLDNNKAKKQLGWSPKWTLGTSLEKVIEWTRVYSGGQDARQVCREQIRDYLAW